VVVDEAGVLGAVLAERPHGGHEAEGLLEHALGVDQAVEVVVGGVSVLAQHRHHLLVELQRTRTRVNLDDTHDTHTTQHAGTYAFLFAGVGGQQSERPGRRMGRGLREK
jgi:hypothetical protein